MHATILLHAYTVYYFVQQKSIQPCTWYIIINIVLQANFKQLLSEMGRKGFVEQLTMVLHQVSPLLILVLYVQVRYVFTVEVHHIDYCIS